MRVNRLSLVLAFVSVVAAASAADAKTQASTLYNAIRKQDWRQLYYLASFSPRIKKSLGSPDSFAADVRKGLAQGGNAKQVTQLFNSMRNVTVGSPSIQGNKAAVPTGVDIVMNGRKLHFRGMAYMVKEAGTWKWDLAYTDDVQSATAKRIQELIGKPDGK